MRRLRPYKYAGENEYPPGSLIICPGCGRKYTSDTCTWNSLREWLVPRRCIKYPCGGGHFRTVDLDGNPIWEGWCGLEKQLDLPFPKEEEA
jgi:hypothetical protein